MSTHHLSDTARAILAVLDAIGATREDLIGRIDAACGEERTDRLAAHDGWLAEALEDLRAAGLATEDAGRWTAAPLVYVVETWGPAGTRRVAVARVEDVLGWRVLAIPGSSVAGAVDALPPRKQAPSESRRKPGHGLKSTGSAGR